VKYAPKVKVNVMGSLPGGAGGAGASVGGAGGGVHLGTGSRIVEHSQVRLECRADANPSDVRYRWFINDEPIIGGQKTEMVSGAPSPHPPIFLHLSRDFYSGKTGSHSTWQAGA